MKRHLFLTLLMVLLLILTMPLSAQRTDPQEWWEDGCDPRAFESIAPTSSAYDFSAACNAYITCSPTGESLPECNLSALQALLDSANCATDDLACVSGALLYTAAIQLYDLPFGESIDHVPPPSIVENFPTVLRLFNEGNYNGAFESLPALEDQPANFMIPMVRGLVQFARSDIEGAIESFTLATTINPSLVIGHLARMLAYGAAGDTTFASFDSEWLNLYLQNRPQFADLLQPFIEQYPLDRSTVETWLYFPMNSMSAGPGGTYYNDQTLQPPQPVDMVFLSEDDAIYANGINRLVNAFDEAPDILIMSGDQTSGFEYSIDAGPVEDPFMMAQGGINVEPRAESEAYFGAEELNVFDSLQQRTFLLAPPGTDDPRRALTGLRCGEGALSRIRSGMSISPASFMDGLTIFYEPSEAGGNPANNPNGFMGSFEDTYITFGDPICVGNVVWWQVALVYDPAPVPVGWVAENDGLSYIINPAVGSGNLTYCPAALPARLFAGANARVAPGLGGNNVRNAPTTGAELVVVMPEAASFTVTGEAVCADGYRWWPIEYNGTVGWTVEGGPDAYWTEPVQPEIATSVG